jgi:hypothetical protein
MCDVRKSVARWAALGVSAALLAGVSIAAGAQNRPTQKRARRESNASRQARIARTIQQTYAHQWEVMGGGGYLRWKSGEDTKRNNEVSWAAQTDYFLNPRLAVVGAAQGSFGNAKPLLAADANNFNIQAPHPQINEYFFTGGVNYRFLRREKLAVSAQGTGGVAWGIFSGGAKGLTGAQLGLWDDGFRPAFTLAVNADYNVYPNLALRFSPTYFGTTFGSATGGSFQSHAGFNAGVVYRFGHQR